MEKLFGLNLVVTRIIIYLSAFLMLCMLYKIFFMGISKTHYQVISPNGDYHLTTAITEKDGCIIFNDEFNNETRVCGSYTVKKL